MHCGTQTIYVCQAYTIHEIFLKNFSNKPYRFGIEYDQNQFINKKVMDRQTVNLSDGRTDIVKLTRKVNLKRME